MLNKFQVLFNNIMENVAGNMSSAVFGTPQQAVYNPSNNISTKDTYAPDDNRNLFGAYDTEKKERKPSNAKKPGKKIGKIRNTSPKTAKMFPVIRRTFPETFLGSK